MIAVGKVNAEKSKENHAQRLLQKPQIIQQRLIINSNQQ